MSNRRLASRRAESARRLRDELLKRVGIAVSHLRQNLAVQADAGEILTLQLACWVAEQHANPGVEIPALHESLEDVRRWLGHWTVIVRRRGGRLVAAARGRVERHGEHEGAWDVGRLMVAPDLQGEGLGSALLERVEALAPEGTRRVVLVTGVLSDANVRFYRRRGYRVLGRRAHPGVDVLDLAKVLPVR